MIVPKGDFDDTMMNASYNGAKGTQNGLIVSSPRWQVSVFRNLR